MLAEALTVPPASRGPQRLDAVLVADPDPENRRRLAALLGQRARECDEVGSGNELERRLFGGDTYDLIVCRALLDGYSGLSALARARVEGCGTGFIVYSSLASPWLRVFLSDGRATILSSRVVPFGSLPDLAAGLVAAAHRPVSRGATP
ncbi:MAG: response regulator [Deltaproteobacteria bacterium]|nr:response regulator [Deltaproteobacteria bacterium]